MADGKVASLFVEFRATVNKFAGDMAAISREVRAFDRILYPIARRANDIGIALSAGLTAPILGLGALVLKTGVDFETAFAGVRKTVQASEEELANLRGELIKMSTTAPVTAVEFAKIAQSAGELGLKTADIARFSQTVAELKATTRLSADEASNFLGRFTNITQLPQDQIHNLASTVVALGHGFAASEADIAAFGLRIARTATFVGLTDAQILAFSTALASVGVSAEAGGTAISRTFAELDKAVQGNTKNLAIFALVARQSTTQFAQSFKTDAAGATLSFIEGLKRIKEEGGNVFSVLDILKLSNVRSRDALLALAAGSDKLVDSLRVASDEFGKNGELTRAYGERNKTTAAQLQILKNQVEALGISLFDTFAPAINGAIKSLQKLVDEGIRPAVKAFEEMPKSEQHFVEGVILFAAAIGPAILAIDKLVQFVGGLGLILTKLPNLFEIASAGVVGFGGAITGVAAILAGWKLENVIIDSLGLTRQFDDLKTSTYNLAGAVLSLAGAFGQFAIKEILNDIKNFKATVDAVLGPVKALAIALILPRIVQAGSDIKTVTAFINSLSDTMDGGARSAEGWSNHLSDAVQTAATQFNFAADWSNRLSVAMENTTKVAKVHAAASELTAEELAAQQKAAEALAKEHQRLLDKFKEELAPADALNKELSYLQQYYSNSDIVAVYAKQIVGAAEGQWAHNKSVSGSVGVLYEQAKALETVQELLKEIKKEGQVPTIAAPISGQLTGSLAGPVNPVTVEAFKDFDKAKKQIEDLGKSIRDFSFLSVDQQIEIFNGELDKAVKYSRAFNIPLDDSIKMLIAQKKAAEDSAAEIKAYNDAVNIGIKTADDMAQQIDIATNAVQKMQDAGFADAQIMDILGNVLDAAAKNAKTLGIELDPVIANLIKMHEEMKKETKDATEFEKEISRLTVKIVNDLSKGIADALLSGKSIVDVATKIGKDFAAAFVKAVIDQVVAPLVKQFEQLGKALASAIAKAAAANPIVAAVVAAVIAAIVIVRTLGGTHLKANEFVSQTQNPFGKSLSTLVDSANTLYAAGRQTYQGAQDAEGKVKELWQGFLDDAAAFGKKGRQQATVAQQAIESLTPTFTRVIFGIQQQIEALKPPSVRAIEFTQGLVAYRAGIAALTDERIAELNAEAAAIDEQIHFTTAQIAVQDDMGGSTAELNKQLQDLIYQWDAVQDALHPVIPELFSFAEAVNAVSEKLVPDKTEQFLASVLDATSGSANLEEALGILESIGTPTAIILDRLGGDIQSFANALELSGLPISPLIEKYLKLANASKKAADDMPRIANSLSKLVGDAVDSIRKISGGGDLAQSILDALARLLTGLPAPTVPAINPAVPEPVKTQVNISIADNGTVTNVFTFTDAIGRAEVRDSVIPEITEALNNNTDSTREKWIKILGGAWSGVT